MMQAGLGLSSVSSLGKNIELIAGIKAGTVLSYFNYICFFLQIIILRKEFKISAVLQLTITFVFGALVNFFIYDLTLTSGLNFDLYLLKILLLLVGVVISTFGVSSMIKADLIFLPFEGLCNAITYKTNKPFATIRPIIDLSIVIFSFSLIIVFKIPNESIREGTIITTLIFGKLVGFFNKSIYKSES